MSAAKDNHASPGRSWRDIRQEVSAPAMSRKGRRRQVIAWLKAAALATLAVVVAWGGYLLAHEWISNRAALTTAVHSKPVRDIALITDGMLTQQWVHGVLQLPRSASLMALELSALRDKLLANGQVRTAVLTRSFPDTLVVTLQERTPVARVQAGDESGTTRQLLVARDGVVYDGANYDKAMLAGLPWLDGIRLVRAGRGYAAIDGMSDVSSLLSTAQLQAPHLYRDWIIVSLGRLAERDEIIVKAQDIPEIVFSRKRDFYKQIAQLNAVIEETARVLPGPVLRSVNLSLEGQVPVQMLRSPEELAGTPQPAFSFPSSAQRKDSKRDL